MNASLKHDPWWRLGLALLAFVLWAHPSLVGLPFAALLLLVPSEHRPGWSQPFAGMIGAMSAALLVLTAQSGGRLAALMSAYIGIVSAAFVGLIMMKPAPPAPLAAPASPLPILRQTLQALLIGVLATGALIQIVWGADAWGALAWEATREAGVTVRTRIVEVAPDTFIIYEPLVRFLSLTWPGMLALQTLAGLALAWHLYRRTAGAGVAATSFKDFRMGDGWVWGIVAWLGVLILPVSNTLHVAGTNVGLVASVLYVLRGAAIVVTFAEAFGISVVALVIAAGVAAALAVPLLFVLPGLCTLGITDTWYQYRRRLAAARGAGPIQPKD